MITNNYNLEIIGHRGCRAYLPENSIPAVEHAILAGVDYVDIDVNLTQDHVLIAYHDNIINPDIIC
ncbi:MAG: glycerophosphodiester phosphodiesterase family protein, partial [Burkholderiales bacterium]|nr:glycerophosphodiester phosphodiesterase family protein [Burkholderiales bacterium]